MANSPTSICNMSLGRIGAKRINSLEDTSETIAEAIHCRLHYEQTRNALQRSHYWRFNAARAILSEDTDSPDFEWDHQFFLPNDFLRFRSIWEDNTTPTSSTVFSFKIEGDLLLTDESEVNLRYSKLVTDVTKWDSLFVEVYILQLAKKIIIPLSKDIKLKKDIDDDLIPLMSKVRALDREEGDGVRRIELETWDDARYGTTGAITPKVTP